MNKIKLSNGYEVADITYGTGRTRLYRNGNLKGITKYYLKNIIKDRKQLHKDMQLPKVLGYLKSKENCFIDTSRAYAGSENTIGKSFAGIKRESFQISTKLCNGDQYKGDVRIALEKSLSELNMKYVDVYLMHWPVAGKFIESWKQMEVLYKEGYCKAIGVCNFNIHHLEELKEHATIMPMINQVECHPLFTQIELRNYCQENNIQIMAYTATGRMDERLRKTVLDSIGKKYKKSIAQIIIKWHKQIGNIPIVNTTNISHLNENYNIDDFELTAEEIQSIENININSRLRYDPDNCDFTKL